MPGEKMDCLKESETAHEHGFRLDDETNGQERLNGKRNGKAIKSVIVRGRDR